MIRKIDALYMTVITISTVGFNEVHQISLPGRVFTILLVFGGVGFSLYVAAAIVQFMVEGQIRTILGRRRLDKKIERLKHHYITGPHHYCSCESGKGESKIEGRGCGPCRIPL